MAYRRADVGLADGVIALAGAGALVGVAAVPGAIARVGTGTGALVGVAAAPEAGDAAGVALGAMGPVGTGAGVAAGGAALAEDEVGAGAGVAAPAGPDLVLALLALAVPWSVAALAPLHPVTSASAAMPASAHMPRSR